MRDNAQVERTCAASRHNANNPQNIQKKPPWDKRDSQHNKQKSRQTSKFTLAESHTGKKKCKTEKLAHYKKCQTTTTNSKNDNCR